MLFVSAFSIDFSALDEARAGLLELSLACSADLAGVDSSAGDGVDSPDGFATTTRRGRDFFSADEELLDC